MTETVTFLVGFIYAVIELLKTGMKSFNLLADDNQRNFVVRLLAVAVGIASTLALQVDVLHAAAPTLGGMIITGAGLAIMSDLLQIGTDFGKAKVEQAKTPPSITSTSIKLEAETVSTPEGRAAPESPPRSSYNQF